MNNRLRSYAHRPAPLIVAWIGTAMPLGVDAIDYLLADDILVPGETIAEYPEEIVYLPKSALAWCPPTSAPPVGPVPSLERYHVVFGCFTRIVKFGPETIDLWARVLHRIPKSRFMLKHPQIGGANRRRLVSMFVEQGIDPERLIFKAGTGHGEHLATYNEIDIVLDCFPQNGGMSSLEALWMGVPVITLCHPTKPSGRAGKLMLDNIGLSTLVAKSADDYAGLAEMLVGSPDHLKKLRENLRQRFLKSPLCDVEGFQQNVSAAFRHMWRRYCDGLPLEGFSVADLRQPDGAKAAPTSRTDP